MTYRGHRICANANFTKFWDVDKEGELGFEQTNINYQIRDEDSEIWYSVIDKDNWCIASFETIQECKDYIKENE